MSEVPALSIQNLSKTYDNGFSALKDVSLTNKGSVISMEAIAKTFRYLDQDELDKQKSEKDKAKKAKLKAKIKEKKAKAKAKKSKKNKKK